MSLAMSAAPFNEINDESINSLIEKKRTLAHNKTQRRHDSVGSDNQRVKYALDEIHNNSVDSEDGNNLDDFKPPPPPISSGVEKTEERTKGKSPPRPIYEDSNLDMNNIKSVYGTAKKNDEYYNNVIPGYRQQSNNVSSLNENDVLLTKLNYMINLLEEQQDERTNNVTEEVVLYSFLGIFIIFIVDSFAKTGKYVR
jgi:hypothetical protein